jgi:hypothetical protein
MYNGICRVFVLQSSITEMVAEISGSEPHRGMLNALSMYDSNSALFDLYDIRKKRYWKLPQHHTDF